MDLKYINILIKIEEGLDVTEYLGVEKYEPVIPACLNGVQKGGFPSFIPKTDETRVQTLEQMLGKYQGTKAYISLKLDGSSATYYIREGKFGVCSRGMELVENEKNSFWEVARREGFEEKMREMSETFGRDISLQGELVGPGIQKNLLGLKQHKVYFFNLFSIDDHTFFSGKTLDGLCAEFDLKMVPVLDWEHVIHDDINHYINTYNGMSHQIYQNKQIEGVVIRPLHEIHDSYHGRISFKVINNKFLLKNED